MTDFESSFSKGITAAEKAAETRAEITGVFDELNRQIQKPSNGNLVIERRKLYESANPFKISILEKRETYLAITASNPNSEDTSFKELARWEQSRTGYPCIITFAEEELYCDDKEALEQSLSELLEDPVVGEVLVAMMNRKPAVATDKDSKKA